MSIEPNPFAVPGGVSETTKIFKSDRSLIELRGLGLNDLLNDVWQGVVKFEFREMRVNLT